MAVNIEETNSTNVTNSRYVAGGETEVNTVRLEWWERSVFQADPSDNTIVVDMHTAGRIDNIAYTYLGDSRLWWFIAQYNGLLDPWAETSIGRVLYIPTVSRAKTLLTGQLGGYPSTREVPTNFIVPVV
jgi:hypothetical protein